MQIRSRSHFSILFVDLNFGSLTLEENEKCIRIDIEEITTNWAWKMFNIQKNPKQNKKKNLNLEIDWSDIICENSDTMWLERDGVQRLPICNVVVDEKFENDTDEIMEQLITLNKNTKIYYYGNIKHSYTIGKKFDVPLSMPTSGPCRQISLTKTSGTNYYVK